MTIGSNSQAITQAQWLVRTYLAVLAAGFDRAHVFEIADNTCSGTDCSTQFATSGVIDSGGTPKPSYYFIATLRARLANMRYAGEVSSGNPSVTLADKQPMGTEATLTITSASVAIDVTETPTIVLVQ